jgi:hypothetical protein
VLSDCAQLTIRRPSLPPRRLAANSGRFAAVLTTDPSDWIKAVLDFYRPLEATCLSFTRKPHHLFLHYYQVRVRQLFHVQNLGEAARLRGPDRHNLNREPRKPAALFEVSQ